MELISIYSSGNFVGDDPENHKIIPLGLYSQKFRAIGHDYDCDAVGLHEKINDHDNRSTNLILESVSGDSHLEAFYYLI